MAPTQAMSVPAIQTRIKLSQSGSLLLDVIRFLAAYVVLIHHFLDLRYSDGLGNVGALGREAVCVFFVLSGFVIRFITITRIGTLREYAIDRISRIYSVVGPALIFTFLCELVARHLHPDVYRDISRPFPWSHIPAQMVANITFLSQLWGYDLSPLSNVSFWSLSFEVVYYVLYALLFYRVRHRWVWISLILIVSGPNIALLFLVWLLGAWTCDLYLYLKRRQSIEWIAGAIFLAVTLVFFLLRRPIKMLIDATGFERRTHYLTELVAGQVHNPADFHRMLYNGGIPWISQLSVSFTVVSVLTAAFMLVGMTILDRYHPSLPPALTRYTRTIADSTFTLYLFHLPLLLLLVTLIGHRISSKGQAVALMIVIPVLLIPIAIYLDHLKNAMRRGLHRLPGMPARS